MDAVRAAMEIKWFLSKEFTSLFEKYTKLDYGIGIDWGNVYVIRAGISRDANNNDLVFIGECVNFAVAIANQAKSPNNIEVSLSVYNNLDDDYKYANDGRIHMWKNGRVEWNGVNYKTMLTSYHWGL